MKYTIKCKCPNCGSKKYSCNDDEYPIMKCDDCGEIFWSD